MNSRYAGVTFVIFLTFIFVFIDATSRQTRNIGQDKLKKSINQFAFTLYNEIEKSVPGKNVFLSPVSISTALAIVYLGARGTTRQQMASAMHFDISDTEDNTVVGESFKKLSETLAKPQNNYTLNVANRLFCETRYKFREDFLRDAEMYFQAAAETLSFIENSTGSRVHINDWVREKTNGKIKDLLPDGTITSLTRLVLVNAIYFKGSWAHQFKASNTRLEIFHLSRDRQTTIEMMHLEQKRLNYHHSSELGCQVVELEYLGGKSSMFVLLPDDVEGVSAVEGGLSADSLENIYRKVSPTQIKLSLPKFMIEQSVSLKTFLQKTGMVDLFEEGKADLSGLDGSRELFISSVVHKAYVEVNEEGTEAAGATAAVVRQRGGWKPVFFVADRPFLFMIVEKTTGCVLFLGRLTQPSRTDEMGGIGFPGETAEQRCCVSGFTNSSSVDVGHFHRLTESWRNIVAFLGHVTVMSLLSISLSRF